MTEEDARLRRCVFSILAPVGTLLNCGASACMAWRWSEPYLLTESGRVMSVDWKANEPFQKVQPGYCGLAGKP